MKSKSPFNRPTNWNDMRTIEIWFFFLTQKVYGFIQKFNILMMLNSLMTLKNYLNWNETQSNDDFHMIDSFHFASLWIVSILSVIWIWISIWCVGFSIAHSMCACAHDAFFGLNDCVKVNHFLWIYAHFMDSVWLAKVKSKFILYILKCARMVFMFAFVLVYVCMWDCECVIGFVEQCAIMLYAMPSINVVISNYSALKGAIKIPHYILCTIISSFWVRNFITNWMNER